MSALQATSKLVFRNDDGSLLSPESLEQICGDLMDALLDLEDSGGMIHSSSVSATLSDGSVEVEFTLNNTGIGRDEAGQICSDLMHDVLANRLGHTLTGNAKVQSRDLELVGV